MRSTAQLQTRTLSENIGLYRLASRYRVEITRVLLCLLFAGYLLQVFSPLRLNTDAITYLSLTSSLVDGHGYATNGGIPRFPPGYAATLAALEYAGLASSGAFIALNVLFVALALLMTYGIARRALGLTEYVSLVCCCVVLLSYVLIKHVTLPVAESGFFGLTMVSLYALSRAEYETGTQRWLFVMLAAVVIAAAIMIRTIGIALIPTFVVVFVRTLIPTLADTSVVVRVLAAVAAVVSLFVVAAYIALHSRYLDDLLFMFRNWDMGPIFWWNVKAKLLESGELALNVPTSQLPDVLSTPVMILGATGIVLVVFGLWIRRHAFGALETFLVSYCTILFFWPGLDARLWLPALAAIVLLLAIAMKDLTRRSVVRSFAIVYLCWFAIAGTAALAYSTRISLAGSDFPELYGDTRTQALYRYAFEGGEQPRNISGRALRLLIRYERRTHPQHTAASDQ